MSKVSLETATAEIRTSNMSGIAFMILDETDDLFEEPQPVLVSAFLNIKPSGGFVDKRSVIGEAYYKPLNKLAPDI